MMTIVAPFRSIGRQICGVGASLGLIGQALGGMVVTVPMLMVASPAQAQTCAGSIPQTIAIYGSGAAALQNSSMTGAFSCSGLSAFLTNIVICGNNVTSTSSEGKDADGSFRAKDKTGNIIKFDLVLNSPTTPWSWSGNFAGGTRTAGDAAVNSNGFASAVTVVPQLKIPSQSVPVGDYTAILTLPVDVKDKNAGACASGATLGSGTLQTSILIRVGGTCDIATIDSVNFGTFGLSGGNLIAVQLPVSIPVVCSVGQQYTLNISDGNNPTGSGNGLTSRAMANGTSRIIYGINTTTSTLYSIQMPLAGVSGTGNGISAAANSNGLYVRVPPQAYGTLLPGLYTDTLIATVSW